MINVGDIVSVNKDFGQLKVNSEYYVFIAENEAKCIGIMSDGDKICYWPSRFFDVVSNRADNAIKLQFCLEFTEKETGRKYNVPRPSWEWAYKYTFDEFMEFVSAFSLQRIFREVEEDVISAVLWSCKSKELVDKMKKSMSKNHFTRLVEDIENYGGVWNQEELVSKFMKTVRMLEEMGEIVMARQEDDSIQVDLFCTVPRPMTPEERKIQNDRIQAFTDSHKKEREEARAKKDKEVSDWKKQVGIE
jgi:hypothetical protein